MELDRPGLVLLVAVDADDDVLEVGQWDAIRIPSETMRDFEGGAEGAELLLFGAPRGESNDAEMEPGWWTD